MSAVESNGAAGETYAVEGRGLNKVYGLGDRAAPALETLREVQLPLARPSIMAGANQVIMLALSMVVVAGLVGGGLGSVVVSAVRSLQIGASIEGGLAVVILAVVILAVYLDRMSAALGGQGRASPSWWSRRKSAVAMEEAQPPATTEKHHDPHLTTARAPASGIRPARPRLPRQRSGGRGPAMMCA